MPLFGGGVLGFKAVEKVFAMNDATGDSPGSGIIPAITNQYTGMNIMKARIISSFSLEVVTLECLDGE